MRKTLTRRWPSCRCAQRGIGSVMPDGRLAVSDGSGQQFQPKDFIVRHACTAGRIGMSKEQPSAPNAKVSLGGAPLGMGGMIDVRTRDRDAQAVSLHDRP